MRATRRILSVLNNILYFLGYAWIILIDGKEEKYKATTTDESSKHEKLH